MLFIYSTSGIGALEKDAKYVQINKEDFRTTIECHSSDFIVDFEHISQLFEKNSWKIYNFFSLVKPPAWSHNISQHFKCQPHKITKHTQTIHQLLPTNCLSAFDFLVGWRWKFKKRTPEAYLESIKHLWQLSFFTAQKIKFFIKGLFQ